MKGGVVGALIGALVLGVTASAAAAAPFGIAESARAPRAPDASSSEMAAWVVASNDNRDRPFMIIDKTNVRLILFDAHGRIEATSPVLLGMAHGDDSPTGIGNKPLASITAAERITPAGRFVAEPGENMAGQDIVWIDYDAAVSLHRASDRKPGLSAKSRVDRLTTLTGGDNRVSLGCVNVSTAFFDDFARAFGRAAGIIYILPETRSVRAEFHMPLFAGPARR